VALEVVCRCAICGLPAVAFDVDIGLIRSADLCQAHERALADADRLRRRRAGRKAAVTRRWRGAQPLLFDGGRDD
jgi:hypothetical protein